MNTLNQQLRYRTSWAVLLFTVMLSPVLFSQPTTIELPNTGWTSWEVDTLQDAPQWCCVDSQLEPSNASMCDLDARHYTIRDFLETYPPATTMQLYVHTQNGQIDTLYTRSADCPIRASSTINHRIDISMSASIEWLKELINSNGKHSANAIQALSIHNSKDASNELLRIAQSDQHIDNRKQAIFWIGQVRAKGLGTDLEDLMFNDEKPFIREQAAFSLSQSGRNTAAEKLIKLANTDTSKRVRGQAWFWLAQTRAKQSEAAIYKALDQEKSASVREQAIFALSQLPEERSIPVLIDIVKDRSRKKNERHKALFWLIHTNTDEAIAQLDDLLATKT